MSIPSVANNWPDDNHHYEFEIVDIDGGNNATFGAIETGLVWVTDDTGCWEQEEWINFSTANSSLSNLNNFIQSGPFDRGTYGASGTYGDYCAKALVQQGEYLGFQVQLEANTIYQVSWNMKTEKFPQPMRLRLGSNLSNLNDIGEARTAPVRSNAQTGIDLTYEVFSVPTSGLYFIVLEMNGSAAERIRVDDFRLSRRCTATSLSLAQDEITVVEGFPVEVCVNIDHAAPGLTTTAELVFLSSQFPHFSSSAPQTVSFPPGTSGYQCVTFHSAANGILDDNHTYTIALQEASGGWMTTIAEPSQMTIHITDDTDYSNCAWAGPGQTICAGDNIIIGADPSVLGSECTNEEFCYRWWPETGVLNDGYYLAQPQVAPTTTTTYTVYITDGESNVFSDEMTVTVGASPEVSIAPASPTLCLGESLTLTASASGGSGSYAYQWSNGQQTLSSTINAPGDYWVVVTDQNTQCSHTETITVGSPDMPYTIENDNEVLCSTNPVANLSVVGVATGTPLSYLWSTGASSAAISTSTPGLYSVTVTNTETQCGTILETLVSDLGDATIVIGPSDPVLCPGSSVLLNSYLTGYVLPAGGNLQYAWSSGESTASFTVNAAGTYTVTITLPSGCELEESITVVADEHVLTIDNEGPIACSDASQTLSAIISPSEAGATYLWSTGETTANIEVYTPDNYAVTVSLPSGCSFNESVDLSSTDITLSIDHYYDYACAEAPQILTAQTNIPAGEVSYEWSNGATAQSLTANAPGPYAVTVTDGNGCTASTSVDLGTCPVTTRLQFVEGASTITEGEEVTFCVSITDPSPDVPTTALLTIAGSATPHFTAYTPQSILFPAGSSEQVCITLPTSEIAAAANMEYYAFILSDISGGYDATSGVPAQSTVFINKTHSSGGDDCWESVYWEDFTNATVPNLTDVPNLEQSGFQRYFHGASGQPNDYCARSYFNPGAYLGLSLDLEAGKTYRFSWNAKCNAPTKYVEVAVGSVPANAENIGAAIPLYYSPNLFAVPGQLQHSAEFTVESSGDYVVILRAPAGFINGQVHFDNLHLEARCPGPPPSVSFNESSSTHPELASFEVCLSLSEPATQAATVVTDFVRSDNSPHFILHAFPQQISFAAGEQEQCITLYAPYTEYPEPYTSTYRLRLSEPEGITIGDIPEHTIRIAHSPPTLLSFSTSATETWSGAETPLEICVDISNPSAEHDTEVTVDFSGLQDPHFPDFTPQLLTFPAGSDASQCFELSAQEVFTLITDESYCCF